MSTYFLGRACWIVRQLDSSPRRLAIFADVAKKNIIIRLAHITYEYSPGSLKSLLLILYGLKCYLSVNWAAAGKAELAFFASYPNERVVLGVLRRRLTGLSAGEITLSKLNCLQPDALLALPAFLVEAWRLQRLARRLAARFHFMPACRVLGTVAFYARFRRLLRRHEAKAVVIANHYSPECLALAAAAHRSGRKVLFANHANATWETGYVPPLYSDLAAVTSQAVLDIYLRHTRKNINAVFIPLASAQRPLQLPAEEAGALTVGVFLTALTRVQRLRDLVAQLERMPAVSRILIRPHPVKLIKDDLAALCGGSGRVKDTDGMALFDNIAACDVVICGNSTVTVEILRGGVPVLYDAALDGLPYDYNGYVKHALVPPVPPALGGSLLRSLKQFYGAPSWTGVMRYFDAGYQQDEGAMFRRLDDAVREALQ